MRVKPEKLEIPELEIEKTLEFRSYFYWRSVPGEGEQTGQAVRRLQQIMGSATRKG
jgi:hypothetical protein